VLIVDDSAYIRKVVKEMLAGHSAIEVVGAARDGEDALDLVERLRPDVVTCDLIMPGVGGVEFIRRQMAARPVPIVIVSIAAESSERVLSGLDAGAIDFVQKPTALATERVFDLAEELASKIVAAAEAPLGRLREISPAEPLPQMTPSGRYDDVRPFAIVIKSGTVSQCWIANHFPVRPKPAITSSATSRMSWWSQISRTPWM
jgi:two-component system chemotaxis response regulator CheB